MWILQLILFIVAPRFTLAQNPEGVHRDTAWLGGGAEREGARHALAWLEAAQNLGGIGDQPGGGWGSDAPRAILALQLANCSWLPNAGVKAELAATQLELQVALLLWRHHEPPVSAGRLAQYTLALGALCRDPREFHGHDLISLLLRHEPDSDFEFAFVTLAVCSSGSHARKRQIRRLLDVAGDSAKHSADTLAMVILAMRCVAREHRHRDLHRYMAPPAMALAALQQPDGSFGNLHTTALAMQALQVAGSVSWDRGGAMNLILSHQSPDGSFGDAFTTTEVALALQPRGLAHVTECSCPLKHRSVLPATVPDVPDNEPSVLAEIDLNNLAHKGPIVENYTSPEHSGPLVTVTYTLWAQKDLEIAGALNANLELRVPFNSSFYHVMELAARADPRYVFEASVWPNGHYVHTLGGQKEIPSTYRYWLLYLLPQLPDIAHPPAKDMLTPRGVDDMFVKDGDHFLFWYRRL